MISPILPRWPSRMLCMVLLLLVTNVSETYGESPLLPHRLAPCKSLPQQLAKGKFLVASRELLDPNFHEAVILLADYGETGASGLIINRPTPVTLSEILPGEESLRPRNDPIYIGGPVGRDRLILLIRSAEKPMDAQPLFDDVYISGSASTLRDLAGGHGQARFRAYMGYAGWGPGQLESEVERGDWWVVPAEAEAIFEKPPMSLWQKLIERSAGEWAFDGGEVIPPARYGRAAVATENSLARAHLAPERAVVQKVARSA
jgi:putative transcriptional regulator